MTPEGRRHYLPLWLVEAFHDDDVSDQATFQAWHLVNDARNRAAQLPLYSREERLAIAACLRAFATTAGPVYREQALAAAPLWES